jgi:hypothetical protein
MASAAVNAAAVDVQRQRCPRRGADELEFLA